MGEVEIGQASQSVDDGSQPQIQLPPPVASTGGEKKSEVDPGEGTSKEKVPFVNKGTLPVNLSTKNSDRESDSDHVSRAPTKGSSLTKSKKTYSKRSPTRKGKSSDRG
eukprot:GHVT01030950.1.p1 GENE.GHVT01030950.1~~GHVT01030950.1.p1  ORF type:complete len:108 (+),score=4.24 GHVT01030950.1:248-571(+)